MSVVLSAPSEKWPSGRRRTPGKCVYGNVSRVRIPPSPPFIKDCVACAATRHLKPGHITYAQSHLSFFLTCHAPDSVAPGTLNFYVSLGVIKPKWPPGFRAEKITRCA